MAGGMVSRFLVDGREDVAAHNSVDNSNKRGASSSHCLDHKGHGKESLGPLLLRFTFYFKHGFSKY